MISLHTQFRGSMCLGCCYHTRNLSSRSLHLTGSQRETDGTFKNLHPVIYQLQVSPLKFPKHSTQAPITEVLVFGIHIISLDKHFMNELHFQPSDFTSKDMLSQLVHKLHRRTLFNPSRQEAKQGLISHTSLCMTQYIEKERCLGEIKRAYTQ